MTETLRTFSANNNSDLNRIGIDDIKTEIHQLINLEQKGIFTVRPANDRINEAKTRPISKMLLGEFWLEGELCILFAEISLGKSILAVQVGCSISEGKAIGP